MIRSKVVIIIALNNFVIMTNALETFRYGSVTRGQVCMLPVQKIR